MDLTKWPRLLVTGEPVSEEQANEILIRTNLWPLSVGDRGWPATVARMAGVEIGEYGLALYESLAAFEARARVLDLRHLHTQRVTSAWVGGPHGWCDWDGTVGCTDYNIGKWPSVEAVEADWREIAAAFPYLTLRAQLAPDEGASPPVVEWHVSAGSVVRVPVGEPIRPSELTEATILGRVLGGPDAERGVSEERLRAALEQVTGEAAVR